MPIDTHKQLQDLLRTAEAFRRAMIVSGAVNHVGQSTYMDQLRALECALQPLNYVVPKTPLATLIDQMRIWPAADGKDGLNSTYVEKLLREASDELESWSIVEQLREPEGACVSLFCDNPDFGGPNNALEITDDWTGWEPLRFDSDTILNALRAALAARTAHEILKNQERKDSGR